MTAYKCDRCGRYFDPVENPCEQDKPYVDVSVRIVRRNCSDIMGLKKEYDLCEHCMRQLYSFLDNFDDECIAVNDDD